MIIRPAALAFAAVLCIVSPAFAADPAPAAPVKPSSAAPALSADDKVLVQKAVDYLQALQSAEGEFTQIDAKGKVTTGAFFMQRPGKARFQYNPPSELLVVADGANVSIYDRRLKSFDQYPLEQTPLKLLLGKTVRLDQGVVVTSVDRRADGFAITARDARHPALGGIVLQFSQARAEASLALTGWTVLDAQGQKTEVRLKGFAPKTRFPANLFVLHDPSLSTAKP